MREIHLSALLCCGRPQSPWPSPRHTVCSRLPHTPGRPGEMVGVKGCRCELGRAPTWELSHEAPALGVAPGASGVKLMPPASPCAWAWVHIHQPPWASRWGCSSPETPWCRAVSQPPNLHPEARAAVFVFSGCWSLWAVSYGTTDNWLLCRQFGWSSGVWTLDGVPFKYEQWLGSCLSSEKRPTCSQSHHLWLSKAVAWLQNKDIDQCPKDQLSKCLGQQAQPQLFERLPAGPCGTKKHLSSERGNLWAMNSKWPPRHWNVDWGPQGVPRTAQTSTFHPGRALPLWLLLRVLLRAKPQRSGKISLEKRKYTGNIGNQPHILYIPTS